MVKNGNDAERISNNDCLKDSNDDNKKDEKKYKTKVHQALNLPVICNINPRSIYNKQEEFHDFVKEEMVDAIFMSESWERNNFTLDKVIHLEDHMVISNVSQRKGCGGRPALIVNKSKYEVENVTNTLIQIPWGVEAVWGIITPKNINQTSKIKKIACCALYSKPNSKKKSLLLDHINDAFNILSAKYGTGLHYIIAGDTNDLKLDSILNLSPQFQQIVQDWTRMDPPALLDPIITTLSSYYQVPICLEPLDPDPDKNGKKSDHKIVLVKPINTIDNKSCRKSRIVKVRPYTESGFSKMKEFLIEETWEKVKEAKTSHDKASIFQNILLDQLNKCFPEKTRSFSNDDQPWITHRLKVLDRKRKRIYRRERRSEKWKNMNKQFKIEVKHEKAKFYKTKIQDLKQKKPGQWYSWLKRVSTNDQTRDQMNIDDQGSIFFLASCEPR